MAQSKINETEFPGVAWGREGNQLSSTPIREKEKPCLLVP